MLQSPTRPPTSPPPAPHPASELESWRRAWAACQTLAINCTTSSWRGVGVWCAWRTNCIIREGGEGGGKEGVALEVVESTRRAGEEKNWWQESEVLPGATFWVVVLVLCVVFVVVFV